MDHFKKKFVEEATDLIDDLEKALLEMEGDPEDQGTISEVFRVMHSLKGGAAMFGFDLIDEFTHNLETVYDLVRSGKIPVSEELLNVTLASVDHLKLLLATEELEGNDAVNHHKLTQAIASIIKDYEGQGPQEAATNGDIPAANGQNGGDGKKTFFIRFLPDADLFANGTNPLFLIDELAQMGDMLALPNMQKVPPLSKINPVKCYTHWSLVLATEQDQNNINDVFIFVEDECELTIEEINQSNLLEQAGFANKLKKLAATGKDIELLDIQSLVKPETESPPQAKTAPAKAGSPKKAQKFQKTRADGKETMIQSIRVSSDKLDELMGLVSELVTTQARLSLYADQQQLTELEAIAESVEKISRRIRDNAFSIVLIPIENLLTRFQRLVRDISGELGKDVMFRTEGAETELDKTIIENLAEPIMHILRNSLDHGIEDVETRRKLGKPEQGDILLKAYYSGANVHIQISDDGKGIDADRIMQKAIEREIIPPDANLSEKEKLDLIFQPGLSTAGQVTDLSGRGVGMDVVRRKIAEIRGEVEIDSAQGKGTTITIKLPLTLSIIDGLLVKIQDIHFVIPLTAVRKIYKANKDELEGSFNNILVLDGEQVEFFHLRQELSLCQEPPDSMQVVVVSYEDKKIGLSVDYVVGEYQAVLKPLGKHYRNIEYLSGATILGDGTIALVMDTNKAIKQFAKTAEKKENETTKQD